MYEVVYSISHCLCFMIFHALNYESFSCILRLEESNVTGFITSLKILLVFLSLNVTFIYTFALLSVKKQKGKKPSKTAVQILKLYVHSLSNVIISYFFVQILTLTKNEFIVQYIWFTCVIMSLLIY